MKKVRLTITGSQCRSGYFHKGQEFIVEDLCPPLCHELWNVIYPYVFALQNGGNLDCGNIKNKSFDAVCPDGARVSIHGEVIESETSGNMSGGKAMYCENCCILFAENRCPVCGNKKVRIPEPDDYCFLTEKEMIWAGMLEDVLKQNGIPYFTKQMLGAGLALKIGPMSERCRFYVPYSHFQEADELVEALFAPVQEEGKETDPEE
ncbi:MAG: TIGR04076 family protein [Clostridia bacterium]|nr:TIGR04076 family protein [Clostridia bacterium]